MKNEEMKIVRCGCGGEAQTGKSYSGFYSVECMNCGMQSGYYDTESEAIQAWNRAMGNQFRDVTKKGKWLWDEEVDRCFCSECGEEDDLSIDGVYMMHDFCPNCGADMK